MQFASLQACKLCNSVLEVWLWNSIQLSVIAENLCRQLSDHKFVAANVLKFAPTTFLSLFPVNPPNFEGFVVRRTDLSLISLLYFLAQMIHFELCSSHDFLCKSAKDENWNLVVKILTHEETHLSFRVGAIFFRGKKFLLRNNQLNYRFQ